MIGIADDELEAAVQVFFVRRGRVVGRKGFVIDKVEDVSPGELVDSVLEGLYYDPPPMGVPKQVLVPVESADPDLYQRWLTEQRGSRVTDPGAAAGRQAGPARDGDPQRHRGVHPPPAAPGRRPQHAGPRPSTSCRRRWACPRPRCASSATT